jgi:uncharacterized protein
VNNKAAGSVGAEIGTKRLLAHAVFTPGQPDWLDDLYAALALKPDSMKGYTIGDNTHKSTSRYPWRMDDEKVAYKAYEKFVKAGVKNVCVHKGLFPPSVEKSVPNLRGYVDVSDVGQAAKDWPQLNFVIYHSGYRYVGDLNIDPALGRVRTYRADRMGQRSCGYPGAIRGRQRLRGSRPSHRNDARGTTSFMRYHPGNPSERAWPRTRLLGD